MSKINGIGLLYRTVIFIRHVGYSKKIWTKWLKEESLALFNLAWPMVSEILVQWTIRGTINNSLFFNWTVHL